MYLDKNAAIQETGIQYLIIFDLEISQEKKGESCPNLNQKSLNPQRLDETL